MIIRNSEFEIRNEQTEQRSEIPLLSVFASLERRKSFFFFQRFGNGNKQTDQFCAVAVYAVKLGVGKDAAFVKEFQLIGAFLGLFQRYREFCIKIGA